MHLTSVVIKLMTVIIRYR